MMKSFRFVDRVFIKHTRRAVEDWQRLPSNFPRCFPSWTKMKVLSVEDLPAFQCKVTYVQPFGFLRFKQVCRFYYSPDGSVFNVKMEKGIFKRLDLSIEVRGQSGDSCEIVEKIDTQLRFGWFFPKARKELTLSQFQRYFDYKHKQLVKDLDLFARIGEIPAAKILVTGASGLIGSSLVEFLTSSGHDVWRLRRSKHDRVLDKEVVCDLEGGIVDRSTFEGFDYIIHLCGSSLRKRWTKKAKEELILSRYEVTKNLTNIIAALEHPPKAFLSASAIGYYGDCGSRLVDEEKSKGNNSFLADVCLAWENATTILKKQGVRVVNLRFGVVMSAHGGAMASVIPVFKWGLGGILGDGRQFMSWIAIEDAVGAIYHAILTEELSGPVNIVTPFPVTNREFTHMLASYLNRPVGLALPSYLLRLIKGQMANELLLSSTKVEPRKLIESGFRYRYPDLPSALENFVF